MPFELNHRLAGLYLLFQRSTWAVSPVSLPTAVCCSLGITAA